MSAISETLKALKDKKRKALVIFITAGDPSIGATVKLAQAAFDAGADIVELGVPFSDPVADGPVIQESFYRAIAKGANIAKTLDVVKKIRANGCDKPIVLMLTCTLVIHYGTKKFMADCAKAGVDGLILPDVPQEEAAEFIPFANAKGLDTIMLAAPTTAGKRVKDIARLSSGFLYYINVTGVTGKTKPSPKEVGTNVTRIKKQTRLPVIAGFGVTNAIEAKAVSRHADGIVIGSQAVRVINNAKPKSNAVAELTKFVKSIREGLDGK